MAQKIALQLLYRPNICIFIQTRTTEYQCTLPQERTVSHRVANYAGLLVGLCGEYSKECSWAETGMGVVVLGLCR